MLKRPNLDEDIIQLIMDKTVANMLSQNNIPFFVLGEVCLHPNTPNRILEDFANNEPESLWNAFGEGGFWSLRKAVTQNPKTPLSVLEILREDNLPEIREAAILAIRKRG